MLLLLFQADLIEAIDAAGGADSYTYTFSGRMQPDGSDPFEYRGRGVRVGDTIYTQIKGTGGLDRRIIVAPDGTRVLHAFEGWMPAEVFGQPDAGRGLTNPTDVLGLVRANAARAVDGAIRFEGAAALDALRALKVEPAGDSWVELDVRVSGGRVAGIDCRGKSGDVEIGGTVTVEAYDRDKEMTWD